MRVLEKDNTIFFDVDETLISWKDLSSSHTATFNYYGEHIYAEPIHKHITFLIASVARGRNVVVWSNNGWAWCVEVLTKLGLDNLDVTVMSKGSTYVDDKDVSEFMLDRIYLVEKK